MKNLSCDNQFVDNFLVYISGFIMRSVMRKESCDFCYLYLKECKHRMSCKLIEQKQQGGLICPIVDIVEVVRKSNRYL